MYHPAYHRITIHLPRLKEIRGTNALQTTNMKNGTSTATLNRESNASCQLPNINFWEHCAPSLRLFASAICPFFLSFFSRFGLFVLSIQIDIISSLQFIPMSRNIDPVFPRRRNQSKTVENDNPIRTLAHLIIMFLPPAPLVPPPLASARLKMRRRGRHILACALHCGADFVAVAIHCGQKTSVKGPFPENQFRMNRGRTHAPAAETRPSLQILDSAATPCDTPNHST
jgi:hypothetical protein